MAASRGHGLRPGGVVRALGRLVLLIGLGFAAGLMIGVLSEEPKLLAGHLRGESEDVVLRTISENAIVDERELPGSEIEPVLAERQALMETRPEEMPAVPLPIVAAPPAVPAIPAEDSKPVRLWAIQVGAFSDQAAAARLAEALGAKGYPAELLAASGNEQRWRVRVQPVRGEAKAKELAVELKQVERLPTWVLPMEGRSRR